MNAPDHSGETPQDKRIKNLVSAAGLLLLLLVFLWASGGFNSHGKTEQITEPCVITTSNSYVHIAGTTINVGREDFKLAAWVEQQRRAEFFVTFDHTPRPGTKGSFVVIRIEGNPGDVIHFKH